MRRRKIPLFQRLRDQKQIALTADEKLKEREHAQKHAIHEGYVSAWFDSALELDKNVLTLSAGGIGLLVALLTTKGVDSVFALVCYIVATVCFLVTTVIVLRIFKENQDYLEKLITNPNGLDDQNDSRHNRKLHGLDFARNCFLVAGFAFSMVVGVFVAHSSYSSSVKPKGDQMSKNEKPVPAAKSSTSQPATTQGYAQDSVANAGNLQKSFANAGGLKGAATGVQGSVGGAGNLKNSAPAPAPSPKPSDNGKK